jgi:hypothetical protein
MHGLKKAQTASRRGDFQGLTIEEALQKLPEFQGDAKLLLIGLLCLATSMQCNEVLEAPADFIFEQLNVDNDIMLPTPRSLRLMRFYVLVPGLRPLYRNVRQRLLVGAAQRIKKERPDQYAASEFPDCGRSHRIRKSFQDPAL